MFKNGMQFTREAIAQKTIEQFNLVKWNKANPSCLFRVIKIEGEFALIRRESSNPFYNGTHCKALIENLETV